MLKIEVWSDYACPYCYIGKTQLHTALKELSISDYNIRHRVFILEPGKVNHPDRTFIDGLNLSIEDRERTQQTFQKISKMARSVGLNYNMDIMKDVGTIDAHRLTLWASEFDLSEELSSKVFEAYLCEGMDISSTDVLIDLAKEVGLSPQEAEDVLKSAKYMDAVFDDFDAADEKEIEMVPHFIFNDSTDIVGITTVANLKTAITKSLT